MYLIHIFTWLKRKEAICIQGPYTSSWPSGLIMMMTTQLIRLQAKDDRNSPPMYLNPPKFN